MASAGRVQTRFCSNCLAVWLFGFLVTRRRVTRLVWVGDGNAREAQLQTELQPNPNQKDMDASAAVTAPDAANRPMDEALALALSMPFVVLSHTMCRNPPRV